MYNFNCVFFYTLYAIVFFNVNNRIFFLKICNFSTFLWRHAVAQLVEALPYKPEGRGFDSRWYH